MLPHDLAKLRREAVVNGKDEAKVLSEALAQAFVQGAQLEWLLDAAEQLGAEACFYRTAFTDVVRQNVHNLQPSPAFLRSLWRLHMAGILHLDDLQAAPGGALVAGSVAAAHRAFAEVPVHQSEEFRGAFEGVVRLLTEGADGDGQGSKDRPLGADRRLRSDDVLLELSPIMMTNPRLLCDVLEATAHDTVPVSRPRRRAFLSDWLHRVVGGCAEADPRGSCLPEIVSILCSSLGAHPVVFAVRKRLLAVSRDSWQHLIALMEAAAQSGLPGRAAVSAFLRESVSTALNCSGQDGGQVGALGFALRIAQTLLPARASAGASAYECFLASEIFGSGALEAGSGRALTVLLQTVDNSLNEDALDVLEVHAKLVAAAKDVCKCLIPKSQEMMQYVQHRMSARISDLKGRGSNVPGQQNPADIVKEVEKCLAEFTAEGKLPERHIQKFTCPLFRSWFNGKFKAALLLAQEDSTRAKLRMQYIEALANQRLVPWPVFREYCDACRDLASCKKGGLHDTEVPSWTAGLLCDLFSATEELITRFCDVFEMLDEAELEQAVHKVAQQVVTDLAKDSPETGQKARQEAHMVECLLGAWCILDSKSRVQSFEHQLVWRSGIMGVLNKHERLHHPLVSRLMYLLGEQHAELTPAQLSGLASALVFMGSQRICSGREARLADQEKGRTLQATYLWQLNDCPCAPALDGSNRQVQKASYPRLAGSEIIERMLHALPLDMGHRFTAACGLHASFIQLSALFPAWNPGTPARDPQCSEPVAMWHNCLQGSLPDAERPNQHVNGTRGQDLCAYIPASVSSFLQWARLRLRLLMESGQTSSRTSWALKVLDTLHDHDRCARILDSMGDLSAVDVALFEVQTSTIPLLPQQHQCLVIERSAIQDNVCKQVCPDIESSAGDKGLARLGERSQSIKAEKREHSGLATNMVTACCACPATAGTLAHRTAGLVGGSEAHNSKEYSVGSAFWHTLETALAAIVGGSRFLALKGGPYAESGVSCLIGSIFQRQHPTTARGGVMAYCDLHSTTKKAPADVNAHHLGAVSVAALSNFYAACLASQNMPKCFARAWIAVLAHALHLCSFDSTAWDVNLHIYLTTVCQRAVHAMLEYLPVLGIIFVDPGDGNCIKNRSCNLGDSLLSASSPCIHTALTSAVECCAWHLVTQLHMWGVVPKGRAPSIVLLMQEILRIEPSAVQDKILKLLQHLGQSCKSVE